MAVLLRRIDDMVKHGSLRLENCAMVVCAGLSAKQNSDFAPRILTCCSPQEWFFPANKRLVTLGMLNLNRAFFQAPALEEGIAVDRFSVVLREGWRREEMERPIRYIIYDGSKKTRANRTMLAVFPGPNG
jgi:hypothetical protein